MRSFALKILAAISLAHMLYVPAQAAWPDKPIRMVIPYPAGGGADNTARVVAQQLSIELGQQIIIDNKPGAGGVIGAELVSKSAADGYTVLYDASAFTVNPSLRKLPFDARKDFIAVSLVAIAPQILVVPPSSPFKTVAEILDFARKNPGKLSFASAGGGTGSHLAGEDFNEQAKVNLLHVPYKGGAPALTDVVGGQVSAYFGNVASTVGFVKSGKLKGLAVTTRTRLATLPDVPTLSESGLQGYYSVEWNGVFVPKGTPPEIVQRLNKALKASVNDPKVKQKLLEFGLEPSANDQAAFTKFVDSEINRIAVLVKARSIKVD